MKLSAVFHSLLAFIRALLVSLWILLAIPALLIGRWVPGLGHGWAAGVRRIWSRVILFILGIRMRWSGTPTDEPAIYVGNHRAYLDPLLIMTQVDGVPVAKQEMASWPLIGQASRLAGVYFVRRENPRNRQQVLHRIAMAVRNGQSILIFPEGTTHDHRQVIPFRKGVFRVAVEDQVPVVPFALDFDDPADYWIGDDTFVGHFFRRFGRPVTRCHLSVGPSFRMDDPEALRHTCMEWINGELEAFVREGGSYEVMRL